MSDPAMQLSCDCRALGGQIDPNRPSVSLIVDPLHVPGADQGVDDPGQGRGAHRAPISHLIVEEPSIAVKCHQDRGTARAQPVGLGQVSAPSLCGEMPGHGHQTPQGSIVEVVGQGHRRMLGT